MRTLDSASWTPGDTAVNGAAGVEPRPDRREYARPALRPRRAMEDGRLGQAGLRSARRSESVREACRVPVHVRQAVDGLIAVAVRALDAPVAFATLVASDHQQLLGVVGLRGWWARLGETPLEYSLCRHVVETGASLIISDTREHPLSVDNPLVLETGIRAYAGCPVRTADGLFLGAFAVCAFEPRSWSASDLAILEELAALASLEIAHAIGRRWSSGNEHPAVPASDEPVSGPETSRAGRDDVSHPAESGAPPVVAASNALLRFWSELQNRRVVRVVAVYLAAAWLVIDVSGDVLPPLGLPDSAHTLIVVLALLGMPLVLATAWAFDLTESGIMRTERPAPEAVHARPAKRARER